VNSSGISSSRHQTVKHVKLANEMTFAHSTDRGIAAHLPGIFSAETEQGGAGTGASGSGSGLTASMPRTDDYYVKHAAALAPDGCTCELFHVERLLAEAEASEQGIEHILSPLPTA
jgi:hypothetical protein